MTTTTTPAIAASYRVTFDLMAGIEPITFPAGATVAEIAEQVTAAFAAAEVPIAVTVAIDLEGDAVTVSVDGDVIEHGSITRIEPELPQPVIEPDLRQRLADELHRIADAIVTNRLPLSERLSAGLHLGVLNSRADLEQWAAHLGSVIVVDSNSIPHTQAKIRLGDTAYGPDLTVGAQTHPDSRNEVERLREENETLRAQLADGGTR